MNYYLKEFSRMGIQYIAGYPSTIGLFAQYCRQNGTKIQLKGAFFSSEPVYEWQEKAVKDVFGCKIYNFYGHAERAVHALSCGINLKMHINLESCVLELDPFGVQQYKIIGTSLLNYGMPLIRYNLNDITSGIEYDCPCGRKHPLLQPVETKMEDFVITPDGNRISASILTFPFKSPKGVAESQIVQKDEATLLARVVADETFDDREKALLIKNIQACVGDKMKVFIEIVAEIPRTKMGKFRFVISEIKQHDPSL